MNTLFDTFEHQIFSLFFFVIIYDIGMFLFFYFKEKKFFDNSQNATATIMKLEEFKGSEGRSILKTTLSFQDQSNKEITADLRISSSVKDKLKEGGQIKILYLKHQPNIIKLPINIWSMTKICALSFACIVGLLIYMLVSGLAKVPLILFV